MKLRTFRLCLLACACVFTSKAYSTLSYDPGLTWQTLYSEHFEIHFHNGNEQLAEEVANIAERVHHNLSREFNWQPQQRTQVVVSDRVDASNGWATPLPRNEMNLYVTPPDSTSIANDYISWLEMLITHEYTHILHLDKASGLPKNIRHVMGRLFPLFPNLMQPPWFVEGLATYKETNQQTHTGRGQNSMFRMLMRLDVEQGIKPLRQVNQPLVTWPMNMTRYLYGVYFYQFLEERYGKDKIYALIENYSDNIIPLAINSNSKATLGKELPELWQEFESYLKEKFQPEIDAIQSAGVTPSAQLTHTGYFTGMPVISPEGDIYFQRNDMQSEPQLMRIKQGQREAHAIAPMYGANFAYHPAAGIVVTELDSTQSTNLFADLYHIDPNTGTRTQLTRGGRYLYATWSPDGNQIIAVHNQAGNSALHRLDNQGKYLETLWEGHDKTVLGMPDWSPTDNQLVLSVWRPESQWNLELFDLNTRQWQPLTNGEEIETTPRFTPDGRHILYSADYNGVFNVQRLDLESRQIETLSNILGGAFSPTPSQQGDTLIYLGANAQGFDLYQLTSIKTIDTTKKFTKTVSVDSPFTKVANAPESNSAPQTDTNKDSQTATRSIEDYNALKRIAPTAWLPYASSSELRNEIGINTWGSDPLKRHNYNLLLAYDTKNHWPTGAVSYLYDRWNPTLKLSYHRQVVAYLDNTDAVERFRDLDTTTAEAVWPLFRRDRQWSFHLGLSREVETDKQINSSFGRVSPDQDQSTGVAVSYNSAKLFARAISASNGRQFRLVGENSDANNSDYTGSTYTLDWREFFDLPGQQVFAIRLSAGRGGDHSKPFELGGHIDYGAAISPRLAALEATQRIFRNRRYPLRGYKEGRNDLSGHRMGLVSAEYRFPIALVERGLMAPPVGIHQIHGRLFHDWGEAWDGNTIPDLRRGIGAELISEWVLGYWLNVDLKLGYAKGLDTGGEEQVYLQLFGNL